jgi:Tol biopolymer transport system component
MRPDGTRQRRLSRYATDPAWAPDSRRVAYSSAEGKGVVDAFPLAIVSVDGRRRTLVSGRLYNPVWSPDGKQLAATTDAVDDTVARRSGGASAAWRRRGSRTA